MELKEGYKLIAEFMEYIYIPHTDTSDDDPGWYKKINSENPRYSHKSPGYISRNTLSLNFRHDWGNLMRVILKIESLNHQKFGRFLVNISDDCCTIQATNRTKENTYNKTYCSKTKINSVYESVLLFLDWYNTIK